MFVILIIIIYLFRIRSGLASFRIVRVTDQARFIHYCVKIL